jgi:hypothetical protein
VIELPSQVQLDELNQSFISRRNEGRAGDDTDSDPTSGESIKINTSRDKESTPFSSKKVCRESDTPHSKENEGNFVEFSGFVDHLKSPFYSTDDSETLLLPGDSAEMSSFCEKALKFSKFQIKIYLPVISLQMK